MDAACPPRCHWGHKTDCRLYRYFSWHAGKDWVKPHELPYVPDTEIRGRALSMWAAAIPSALPWSELCFDVTVTSVRKQRILSAENVKVLHNGGSRFILSTYCWGNWGRDEKCVDQGRTVTELVTEPRSSDSHSPALTTRQHCIPKPYSKQCCPSQYLDGRKTYNQWVVRLDREQMAIFSPSQSDRVSQVDVKEKSAAGNAIHWVIYQSPVQTAGW